MAKKLADIYAAVKKEGGLSASMRMAMLTGVPGQQAESIPDSPDMVKKFGDAFKEITGKSCPIT